jgi:hypothetical protein
MSGLSISEGYFKVGHIDHPGTPLQYLVAIVFRITYLFRGNSVPYIQDVFSNPDLYMQIVNISITVMMVVSLFTAGRYVYRKTGSTLYGILIQTIPFISVLWYQIIGRITPELLLPIPIIALSAFLIGHLADKKTKYDNKDLFIISLIMALCLSIKLTMIPLWLIPLVIVKSWRGKIIIGALSVFFFLILALPATLQIERFWGWISDLFIHSGQYGNGAKNVIDIDKLRENIAHIIQLDKYFSSLVALQFLLLPLAFFMFRKKNDLTIRKIIIALALVFAILAQAVIAGKQYAPRYFIPAIMLSPLLFFLSLDILKDFHSTRFLKIGLQLFLSSFLVWNLYHQVKEIQYTSQAITEQLQAREETWHIVKSMEKESIKIVVSQDYGCPFQEYALMFSTAWSQNSLKPYYATELAKLYPNTYQYTTWDDKFRFWADALNPEEIIEKERTVYLYLEKNSEELYNKTIKKLSWTYENLTIEKKLLFENSVNGEGILQLFFSISKESALNTSTDR